MALLNIEIDGKATQVEAGKTIMDAAAQLNVAIPHFCYHKKLSIAANCRMCLVQVEKAPKPLPACATPVSDGMKVSTHSEFAIKAQKGVMEFLLINHPLDCPICDQGGECQLQDLAVGYGGSASRFAEDKRVVANKDLGALISTDMTRCIHCTRCVRYGEEVAGIMELGMGGRGEHSEIMAFMGRTVDSEVSGNAIDLCPVGALTSKPFRYSARTWELRRSRSISPHDGLGANLVLQSKNEQVLRALPGINEEINECWLSDKDRFSYEGLDATDRAVSPRIKRNGVWQDVDWQAALQFAAQGLRAALSAGGPDQLAALASPHQSLEELYVLQSLVRGLGSGNVDHRLRQTDFRLDGTLQGAPWLGLPIAQLSQLDATLVIGSTLRKDHPLIAVRLRQAVRKGARLHVIHVADDDLALRRDASLFALPSALPAAVAEVLVALAALRESPLASDWGLAGVMPSAAAKAIAESLVKGERSAVLIGNYAEHHPHFARLQQLAQEIARLSDSRFGVLGEAANSVGGYLAGAVPFQGAFGATAVTGANAATLLAAPRKAYVLLGCEPDVDAANAAQARSTLESADFVVALTAFESQVQAYADVILPITPFSETAGSFVNTEGRLQTFAAAVKPRGEARPAWKVLRVLGNLLEVAGFDFEDIESVRKAMSTTLSQQVEASLDRSSAPAGADSAAPSPAVGGATPIGTAAAAQVPFAGPTAAVSGAPATPALERVGEFPIYRTDALVRRAPSLQARPDGWKPQATLHPNTLAELGLAEGAHAIVRQGDAHASLPVAADPGLPLNAVRIPAAWPETFALGALFGAVQIERLS